MAAAQSTRARPHGRAVGRPSLEFSRVSADVAPVWSVGELEAVTNGTWLRPPGDAWAPTQVRGTEMGDILPEWLPRSIIFVTSERRLKQWFEEEEPPAREPTGCIIVSRKDAGSRYLPRTRAILVVDNTTTALRALARRGRERMRGGKVLVVTGTVGKTTTRGMLVHILKQRGSVLTNPGNGNFRMHVFMHMASVRPDTEFVVFELGLGGPLNSFRDASEVIRPDVVLLTQLDIAHLDTISRKPMTEREALLAVAGQKLQLADDLMPTGVVIVNRDVPIYPEIREMLRGRRMISYGTSPEAEHRVLRVDKQGTGGRVHAESAGVPLEFDLQLPGTFMGVNGLGAVLAASEVTGPDVDNAAALATFEAVPGRARMLELTIDGVPFTLIDDAYNATPFSMRSSLDLLQQTEPGPGGRRIAVLGDISHLGQSSKPIHTGLAEDVRSRGVDRVYTSGTEIVHLYKALPPELQAGHFKDRDELARALAADLRPGDVVTVKASVPSRFDYIVGYLRALASLQPTQPSPDPVSLISSDAARHLPDEVPVPHRTGELPPGAWLLRAGEDGASLIAGEDVEELPHGIVEGVWDEPFEARAPERAEHLFGSGLVTVDGRLTVLAPKHTLEGVFLLEHKPTRRVFASNSLALACAAADVRLPDIVDRSFKIGAGFYKFDTRIVDTDEVAVHKLVYYNYALRPDGTGVRLELPPAREFTAYAEYRTAVSAAVAALAANAADPERRRSYRPLTTVSSGYDSAACAVLAREVGCTEAITITTSRRNLVDSGRPVGEALGLAVIERDRPRFPTVGERSELTEDEHHRLTTEFFATGMSAEDVFFTAFEDILPGSMLFTGFHGDKYWDVQFGPSTDAKRGDVSGSSMSEFRFRVGFVNLPVPFLFIRSQMSVRTIGRSADMKKWTVGGAYNRPVPRRIVEEAGVPRRAFGQRKMAASVIFNGIHHPARVALRTMADRYAAALEAVRAATGAGV